MNKNRLFIGVMACALCCFGFTACESEEDTDKVITFEDVNLGNAGYWNGSDKTGTPSTYTAWGSTVTEYRGAFVSGDLACNNVYNDTYSSWSGMACSSQTDMDKIGYINQYSVYATSGAGGSKKFAVICPFDSSTCSFSEETEVKSLMINNATYAYWAMKIGEDGYGAVTMFNGGDYFYVTISGFDANGQKTGSMNYYLADYRNSLNYICEDWTKVDLTPLGKVKSLSFKLTSSDVNDYGYMNTPSYACIDNIVYTK
jgi:hypothetical protein